MTAHVHIGLIGDYNDEVRAHRAIPLALARAARDLSIHAGARADALAP